MNRFRIYPSPAVSAKRYAHDLVKRSRLTSLIAIVGSLLVATAHAQNPPPLSFNLSPGSDAIAVCLPGAPLP